MKNGDERTNGSKCSLGRGEGAIGTFQLNLYWYKWAFGNRYSTHTVLFRFAYIYIYLSLLCVHKDLRCCLCNTPQFDLLPREFAFSFADLRKSPFYSSPPRVLLATLLLPLLASRHQHYMRDSPFTQHKVYINLYRRWWWLINDFWFY